jgi:hypothetical protein
VKRDTEICDCLALFYGFAAIGLAEDTTTSTCLNLLATNKACQLMIDNLKTPSPIIPYNSNAYKYYCGRNSDDMYGYELYSYSKPRIFGHDEKTKITGNFTGKGIDTLYVEEKLEYKDKPWEESNYYLASNNPQIPKLLLSDDNWKKRGKSTHPKRSYPFTFWGGRCYDSCLMSQI